MKAKIIAKGFQQNVGIYYFDAFAHVMKWSTIRSIMSIITKKMETETNWCKNHVFKWTIKWRTVHGNPWRIWRNEGPYQSIQIKSNPLWFKVGTKKWHSKINSLFSKQGPIISSVNPTIYYKEKDMKRIIICCMWMTCC